MSLIILSSKGDDPEDFSNYMTQGVKIPKDAEICLVSSHINRKLMSINEIQISAGANTFALNYGSGNFADSRDGVAYTPHAPTILSLSLNSKNFPIKIKEFSNIQAFFNNFMNDSNNIPISTLTNGAWDCDISENTGKFGFFCEQQKPNDVGSLGLSVASNFRVRAGINEQLCGPIIGQPTEFPFNFLSYGSGANVTQSTDVSRNNFVKLVKSEKQGNFIDTKSVWNTDTEATPGTWTALANTRGVQGGCWAWDVSCSSLAVKEDVVGLRGGIIAGNKFNFDSASNNYNILLDPQTGATDYDVWWEISDAGAPDLKSINVNFYYQKKVGHGLEKHNSSVDSRVVKFGTQRKTLTAAQDLRIMMRPVAQNRTDPATLKYIVEAALAIVTKTDGTISGISSANAAGTTGNVLVTDPLSTMNNKFNLYRHLPLRQGTSFSYQNSDSVEVQQSAIHHNLGETEVFSNATHGLPIVIGTTPLQVTQVDVVKPDPFLNEAISNSTIGSSIGFINGFKKSAMNLMQGVGIQADLQIASSVPTTHTLVVQLPDLSITGFYGNTSGSAAAGTLNLNGGGNSAPILGTIPFGKPNRVVNFSGSDNGYMDMNKGQFFAAPMENWIRLNNPNSLVLTSMRCRLTDELGNKPNILDPNTTITIKVRERADRRNVIQGGTVARPDEFRN
tara:strand:+ start:2938 stop:4962 length:2025 start_codon:yes stop_codon:yes gene_type:complete